MQGPPGDAQSPGGLAFVALHDLQSIQDRFLFHLLQGRGGGWRKTVPAPPGAADAGEGCQFMDQGHILDIEIIRPGQDNPPFDGVHQFPDVTRPFVFQELIHRPRGETLQGFPVFFGKLGQKMVG